MGARNVVRPSTRATVQITDHTRIVVGVRSVVTAPIAPLVSMDSRISVMPHAVAAQNVVLPITSTVATRTGHTQMPLVAYNVVITITPPPALTVSITRPTQTVVRHVVCRRSPPVTVLRMDRTQICMGVHNVAGHTTVASAPCLVHIKMSIGVPSVVAVVLMAWPMSAM